MKCHHCPVRPPAAGEIAHGLAAVNRNLSAVHFTPSEHLGGRSHPDRSDVGLGKKRVSTNMPDVSPLVAALAAAVEDVSAACR